MEKTLCVAKALNSMYQKQFNHPMDEMKMHKLMYLSQRESLMYRHAILFDEEFYGWKYGPVLKSVRSEYKKDVPFADVTEVVSPETSSLLCSVMERYGDMSLWKLSSMLHAEFSWKRARKGLAPSDNGDTKLSLNTMLLDAAHELSMRRAKSISNN